MPSLQEASPEVDITDALLEVVGLSTSFRTDRGTIRAVDGVSLTLNRGETLGVVGESGSGKTVLVRTVMGLTSGRRVDIEGQILFDGRDILALPDSERRKLLGTDLAMIFQDPMTALNPVMRVGAQIAEGLRLRRGMSRREAAAAAVELLESVHIREPARRARQYPYELSGGMRQRVIIAIAMACGPRLLIADEPTTALDVTVQSQILDLIDEKRRQLSMSVILVTHDLGVAAERTDHLAVMYAGRIVETGPTEVVMSNPSMPYTAALLRATPTLALESHTRLASINGTPPSLLDPAPGCRFAPRCDYATDRCFAETPPLTSSGDQGHAFACWNPLSDVTAGATTAEPGTVIVPAPDVRTSHGW